MFFGGHVGCLQRVVPHNSNAVFGHLGLHSGLLEFLEQSIRCAGSHPAMFRSPPVMAPDDEGACLNAIWNDAVLGAYQLADSLHTYFRGSGTFNSRAHFVEKVGKILDLGSRAQFNRIVSPSAKVEAIGRSSVPVSVILSKTISAPLRRLARASTYPCS